MAFQITLAQITVVGDVDQAVAIKPRTLLPPAHHQLAKAAAGSRRRLE
jgi:hypothetical protein